MSPVLVAIIIMAVGFMLSAMYSGLETGVYVLNPVRLRLRAAAKRKAALRLTHEVAHPTALLTALLIGNNAANQLGSFGMAELLGTAGFEGWGLVGVQVAVFTPLLFIFAETLPKELFRTQTDHWTYALSPILTLTRWVTSPLLFVLLAASNAINWLARSDAKIAATERHRVSQLLKEGVGAGVLTTAQTSLADRALALRGKTVASVMVPWRDAWTLPLESDGATRRSRALAKPFTRLPVVNRSGHVVGLVSWIDVIAQPDETTDSIMQAPLLLPPETRVLDAMREMRHQRQGVAIIQAADRNQPVGLITLKDLIEPMTGELAAW